MNEVPFSKVDVGQNISCVRKIRKKTQAELAEILGVTQSAVSQFERNEDGIHARTLEKIADALDVDESILVCFRLYDENDSYCSIAIDAIRNRPKELQPKYISDMMKVKNIEVEKRSKGKSDSLSSICMSIFASLNDEGKKEAIKRIGELAQLSQYKEED